MYKYGIHCRGDAVMVMQAGTQDMRKLAESMGQGALGKKKLLSYAAQMVDIIR